MDVIDLILRLAVFLLGAVIVYFALRSAVRTFLLPRPAPDVVGFIVFRGLRKAFGVWIKRMKTYERRDRIMAYYAPVGILCLLAAWLLMIFCGYACMNWAVDGQSFDIESWRTAVEASGSSLFTLGSTSAQAFPGKLLNFSEAVMGPLLIALLIGYMPTIYNAFSKREALVNMLEVRAGSPPSATDLIIRFNRLHGTDRIGNMWVEWERWFSELEETHTSLAMLSFYRSPTGRHSWVTAAGAVLDGAAMVLAAVDIPPNVQANLCIRAGYIALRGIADFFSIPYDPDPQPGDPISVSRESFDRALDILADEGVALKPDRDQAWRDWAGWRVNYDEVLLALARLTMAPPAPWSSPSMPEQRRPPRFGRGA